MNQKEQGKAEIAELLSRRKGQYTHAVLRAALALDRDKQWKNCVTRIDLADGDPVESRSLIYPGFEIHIDVRTPEEALELVDELVTEGRFRIANRVIPLKGGGFDKLGYGQQVGRRVSSGEAWIPNEWPGDQYLFAASRQVNPPTGPLVGLGMPAYPDGFAAIEHILCMDARGGHMWDGGVYFFFPDYRAKIDSVTLGVQSLTVRIAVRKSHLQDLVGKIYVKGEDGYVQQRDIEFETPEQTVDLALRPQHAYFGLLCKSDGQILDQWEYSPHRRPSRLQMELFTPQYVQQLIEHGEDSYVEFKPGKRDDNAKREIAESAVAFSNKNGGIILVGVDDNGRIEGAFGNGWEELIAQSLRDRCDPPIEPTVRRVDLEGKPVYVVMIPESHNKPHLLKGTGVVYIRVAATDKPATRYELQEFFLRSQEVPRPR